MAKRGRYVCLVSLLLTVLAVHKAALSKSRTASQHLFGTVANPLLPGPCCTRATARNQQEAKRVEANMPHDSHVLYQTSPWYPKSVAPPENQGTDQL